MPSHGEAALALEPIVDMKGYTFVHSTSDGFVAERLEALAGGPIALADLGDPSPPD